MNTKLTHKIQLKRGIMILILGYTTISCTHDILDKQPVTEVTAETIDTEDRIESAINAAYDPLQWKIEGTAETFPQIFQSIRADDLHSQQASFWGNGAVFDQFKTITSTNQSTAELWRKLYTGIGRANFAMELAAEFDGYVTDGLRERIIAEGKFLRGFYYLELVRKVF